MLASNVVWNTIFMRVGGVGYRDYFRGSARLHAIGILGGCIWMAALSFNVIASERRGSGDLVRARTGRDAGGGDLGTRHLARIPRGARREHQVPCADAGRLHDRTGADRGRDSMIIEKTNYQRLGEQLSHFERRSRSDRDRRRRPARDALRVRRRAEFLQGVRGPAGRSGEPDWQPRGGHRIWIAPEDPVKSYAPDNGRSRCEVTEDGVIATAPVEPLTGLEKQITVRMAAERHRLSRSRTGSATPATEPYRLAPWALTMMAQGGHGIHGFPPRGTHPEMLEPTNPLVMWAFTNLADERWRLLGRHLVLRQDPSNPVPQKLGSFNRHTWGAYLLNGELFVKRYEAAGAPGDYPDFGCSFETFTNAEFLELETLGPLDDARARRILDPHRAVERFSRCAR